MADQDAPHPAFVRSRALEFAVHRATQRFTLKEDGPTVKQILDEAAEYERFMLGGA